MKILKSKISETQVYPSSSSLKLQVITLELKSLKMAEDFKNRFLFNRLCLHVTVFHWVESLWAQDLSCSENWSADYYQVTEKDET